MTRKENQYVTPFVRIRLWSEQNDSFFQSLHMTSSELFEFFFIRVLRTKKITHIHYHEII